MERKLYDYFDRETMPEDCARRIEGSLVLRPKPAIGWRRFAAAAAVLVLMLAVFNAEAICVNAQEIRDFVVNALSPNTTPVGEVEPGVTITFSGNVRSNSLVKCEQAMNKYLGNQEVHLAEVKDGRLYFIANDENIDITDQCSMDTAFIYVVEDDNGYIHYLCVGGTPENWGSEEHIWNPALGDRIDAWIGGGGYNTWNFETDESRWNWVYDARTRTGYPFNF